MGPGNGRGLGSSGGAVVMALIVAAVVMMMVSVGGGLMRPLVAHRSVAMTSATQGQG